MLKVDELDFSYDNRKILKHISFQIFSGEIATLIGPSGTGKTTLFKLLAGILPVQNGSIQISNVSDDSKRSHVAYMMQEDLLLPWRTVLSNMTLTAELGSNPDSHKTLVAEARDLLSEIDMDGCEYLYPHQLSGGMRQRVALARALLQKRPLLLLDEPFGSLDVTTREQMYLLLRQIRMKYGTTILMVTHDFRDALALADRALLLSRGTISHQWCITDDLRNNPHAVSDLLSDMRNRIVE